MLRRSVEEDALDVGPLILEAAPHLHLLIGGEREALRAAASCYRNPRTMFGYQFGMTADEDGDVAGVVIAFPGGQWGSLRLGTGVTLARAAGVRHASNLIRRGRILDRLHGGVPANALYVSVLAVGPEYRRRGIASGLLERVVRGASAMGLDAALDCDVDNEGARKLYGDLGFAERQVRETTEEERAQVETSGFVRMVRLRD